MLKGDAWKFTTWVSEPNYIVQYIDQNTVFSGGNLITLERQVKDSNGLSYWLTVDSVAVPAGLVEEPTEPNTVVRSYQRDVNEARWIKRLWSNDINGPATLGSANTYEASGFVPLIAYPQNGITNIGEIGIVLCKDAYITGGNTILPTDGDAAAKINLTDPSVQKMFKYLTAIDPTEHGQAAGETRIKGRININTAPWYVIAQLPWVSERRKDGVSGIYDANALAQAIVAYRDKLDISPAGPDYEQGGVYDSRCQATGITGLREKPGFESIGELATVTNTASKYDYDIHYYALDGNDLWGYPDLTAGGGRRLGDGSVDDFKERDVIFARISDLVTVRSDVFTAYILVRVGNNGPQKRVIAILDRSDVPAGGKVKVIAVHPVPDPR